MQPEKSDNLWEALQKSWKPLLIWGGIALGSALCFKYLRNASQDLRKINSIRESIDIAYEGAQDMLVPLTVEKKKEIKDHKIELICHYVSKLKKKQESKVRQMKNPFLPPFEKGKLICELNPNHRLLFNKFNFYKNHLLVVTKEFQEQLSRLTFNDFEQASYVMKSLNGVFFFNCGKNAGYSQNHKHIQILPESVFQLPLISKIRQHARRQQFKLLRVIQREQKTTRLHTFVNFDFIHAIVYITSCQKMNQVVEQYFNAYNTIMLYLNSVFKEKQFCYNLIACEEFLMIIPRSKEFYIDGVGGNAIAFMGSFLVKDEGIFDKIDYIVKPSEFLRELAYADVD